jgi:hypothetical protein
MTSRTHRGIGLVFIPLLSIACLLVLQAAPTSSVIRTKNNGGNELTLAQEKSTGTQKHLKQLAKMSICPFKIRKVKGYTAIKCNCKRGSRCEQDCTQAYLYASDIIPKTGCNKTMATGAKIPAGCIYKETKSIQSPGPEKGAV